MRRWLWLLVLSAGCSSTWQANNASQAVNIDSHALGTGSPVFTPSNDPGYMNGMPQDMRTGKH